MPPQKRSITKVVYMGARRAPFGFLTLRARLSRGVAASPSVLKGRRMFFIIGKTTYQAYTNRAGIARVVPTQPLPPGTHRVGVRYRGDARLLGSGLHVDLTVVNSPADVASKGVLRLPHQRTLKISVASNGASATGDLMLREPGHLRAVLIGALGVQSDGSTAWMRGRDVHGRGYLVHLQRVPKKGRVRIEIIGAARMHATVSSKELSFSRR